MFSCTKCRAQVTLLLTQDIRIVENWLPTRFKMTLNFKTITMKLKDKIIYRNSKKVTLKSQLNITLSEKTVRKVKFILQIASMEMRFKTSFKFGKKVGKSRPYAILP